MGKYKKSIISLSLIFALLLGVFAWSGGFFSPKIEPAEAGSFLFVGIDHSGAYRKISSKFGEVEEKMKKISVTAEPMAGIYYDDPSMVSEDKLRSLAGILTSEEISKQILKSYPDFKIVSIPKQTYLRSEFPNRNFLSMILAVIKTYPKFGEYFDANHITRTAFKETGYESNYGMEIYHKEKIEFLMTIPKSE